jgi:hypothetical protein
MSRHGPHALPGSPLSVAGWSTLADSISTATAKRPAPIITTQSINTATQTGC